MVSFTYSAFDCEFTSFMGRGQYIFRGCPAKHDLFYIFIAYSFQLMADGHPYMLVPSLDGSLYMFNMDSSSLNPIPVSTDISVMIGDDAVAGGTIVSTTGVDPITGQVAVELHGLFWWRSSYLIVSCVEPSLCCSEKVVCRRAFYPPELGSFGIIIHTVNPKHYFPFLSMFTM